MQGEGLLCPRGLKADQGDSVRPCYKIPNQGRDGGYTKFWVQSQVLQSKPKPH